MPTPRSHGGAALLHVPLNVPGFKGLNKQQSSGTLGPEWATVLGNAVIDDNGRVAARNGWVSVTTSSVGDQIEQVFEYIESDGTVSLVASTADSFFVSTDDGASWNDITGTLVFTSGNVQFQNFNDVVYAFNEGEAPSYYNGTGNFTAVTDGSAPQSGIGLSAFGRLWSPAADGHTLKYSALLDGTDWSSADDAGSIDMWTIWPDNDAISALAAFNGMLVVFGKNTIIMFVDGKGSALGLDPLQAYVVDVVKGTGCIARDSVQHVDGDLWFLSDNGLQSLSRLIQQKSNPLENLSKNVQDYLRDLVSTVDVEDIRSVFSKQHRLFLLSLSSGGDAESGTALAFDTRGRLEDGAARCMGTWTLVPSAITTRRNGTLLMARRDVEGKVGTYSGELDDDASYRFEYESGWFDLTQQAYLLIPKRYAGIFFADNTLQVNFKWAFDFSTIFNTVSRTFVGNTGGGEWGVAEWGLGEFGGGVSLRNGKVPAAGTGRFIKLGITADIDNTNFAIQQLDLYCKVGRYD